jgi:16S rRNA (guanine966-N2)-methyltransferase
VRIVGGEWAGVSLISPGGRVRPTPEALRGAWMTWLREELQGARVLDLFAGTGALGLEALSQGAATVDFVEMGAEALHALKGNRTRLRVTRRTRLFKKEVFGFLEGVEERAYDLAFADPPYTSTAGERLARLWLHRPFAAILSIEHARTVTLPMGGVRRVLEDSAVTIYRIRKRKAGGKDQEGAKPCPT